jgi:hypothetical protein
MLEIAAPGQSLAAVYVRETQLDGEAYTRA